MSIFKRKRKKNETNSSMGVTCVADGRCEFRHTTMCDMCKNNMGMQRDKSYFEPKEGTQNANTANQEEMVRYDFVG